MGLALLIAAQDIGPPLELERVEGILFASLHGGEEFRLAELAL